MVFPQAVEEEEGEEEEEEEEEELVSLSLHAVARGYETSHRY
jgi:hypothetical protein